MNYFIKNIHINKLFHLENFDIPIADEKYPHLIITGKNGSGKTVLLNTIANWLEYIKKVDVGIYYWINDKYDLALSLFFNELKKENNDFKTDFLNLITCVYVAKGDYAQALEYYNRAAQESMKDVRYERLRRNYLTNLSKVNEYTRQSLDSFYKNYYGYFSSNYKNENNIICDFTSNISEISDIFLAYYSAQRSNSELKMIEPKSPTKPELNTNLGIKETCTDKFLEFLSDLRIQGALARNEKQNKDADEIDAWFDNFVQLLQQIFQDDALKLEFDYKKYSFKICTEGKKFKFTELADGFAAVLDIVADLILKMQNGNSLTRVYEKEGIVLIDEIETHLHLSLQKNIMPFLTKVFPNIQFIVTTHSPFVLSSMPNAVAFDLEHKKPIKNLANYSYESLAEGYFEVRAESSDVRHRLNKIKELLEKKELTVSEQESLKYYIKDFDSIPEAVSPSLIGEYLQMKLKYVDKIKELMQ